MIEPLFCIIPAYNAASTLRGVVSGVRESLPSARIIVIDDGSADGTFEAARRVADHVIRFPENRGKGAGLSAGFAYALAHGAAAVLTIDADGQHDTRFAPRLVEALERADIVIGSRAREGSMPMLRRLTNALSTKAVNVIAGCDIADSQSGYRAMRRTALERVRAEGDRYEFETDFIIRARRANLHFACVTVPTIYGGQSHFRALHDAARVIRTLWRLRAGASS